MFLPPSLHSYASYLVWKDLGGGFGRPLALPLGLYAAQLAISWTVLTLFFAAHNPGLVRCTELGSGSDAGAGPSGAGRSGGQAVSSSGGHNAPGTRLRGPGCYRKVRAPGLGPACLTTLPPAQALLHLLLLYGLVVTTALIWHPINKLAALLLLPYLAWLTVSASITYRLWRDSLCPEHQPQPEGEKSN